MLTPMSLDSRIDASHEETPGRPPVSSTPSGGLARSDRSGGARLVMLNEQPLPWRESLSAAALLAEQGQPEDRVATALNGEFLPRHARARTLLQPGDELTVFRAIVGG